MLTEAQQRAVIYMAAAYLVETTGHTAQVPVDIAWVHMMRKAATHARQIGTCISPPRPPVGAFATLTLPSTREISSYDQTVLLNQLEADPSILNEFWHIVRPGMREATPGSPLWLTFIINAAAILEIDTALGYL